MDSVMLRQDFYKETVAPVGQTFISCMFENCNFESFNNITFIYCNFTNCEFKNVRNSAFRGCLFKNGDVNLTADFFDTVFTDDVFSEFKCCDSAFSKCFFNSVIINKAFHLNANTFTECHFENIYFHPNVELNLCNNKIIWCPGLDKVIAYNIHVPQTGAFTAWKKVYEPKDLNSPYFLRLLVPADAERVNFGGAKVRVSRAIVEKAYDSRGNEIEDKKQFMSAFDKNFHYIVGQEVQPNSFDPSPYKTCTNGIHCFLTFEQAVQY